MSESINSDTMRCFKRLLICWFLHLQYCVCDDSYTVLNRAPRQLLFPNSTLLQFNFGVGTPTPVKTININWAIQTNFQLPWNRSQIPVDILHANTGYDVEARREKKSIDSQHNEEADEKAQNYENDARLYHFYKYVEDVLNGFGHNGSCCVRHTLCQLAAEPLHSHSEEDVLYELANFVLNPTHDLEENSSKEENEESLQYIDAYNRGATDRDCGGICEKCSLSLIDMFSILHD